MFEKAEVPHKTVRRRAGGASPGRATRNLRCDLLLTAGLSDFSVLESGPDMHRGPAVRALLLGLADRHRHAAVTARAHHQVLRHLTHLRYVLVASFRDDKILLGLRASAASTLPAISDLPITAKGTSGLQSQGHAGTVISITPWRPLHALQATTGPPIARPGRA
jgi:hypothetical protein